MSKEKLSNEATAAMEFLETVARPLCRYPEGFTVRVFETPHRITLSPRCDPEDAGKIIGKSGAVFRALKRLVQVWSERNAIQQDVDVSSVKTPNGDQRVAVFVEVANWDRSAWRAAMEPAAKLLLGQHGVTVKDGEDMLSATYWVEPDAMTEAEAKEAADTLNALGRAVAKTLGGEAVVDVGRKAQ